jgi:DNA adenine methylase
VITLKSRWIVTLDDSPLNRSLWKGHDVDRIQTRNGSGNQGLDPGRHFGELIIYAPGLRR